MIRPKDVPEEAALAGSFKTKWKGKEVTSTVIYFFDADKNELGYKAWGWPFNGSTAGRPWGDDTFNRLELEEVI